MEATRAASNTFQAPYKNEHYMNINLSTQQIETVLHDRAHSFPDDGGR